MLIYKIIFSLLNYIFMGVTQRGVPDANRQKYEQTDDLWVLRQRIGELVECAINACSAPVGITAVYTNSS